MLDLKTLETAHKLNELRELFKRIRGPARWKEEVADVAPRIRELMKAQKTANPLEVVLPIAVKMDQDGACPLALIAVAAEMSENPNPEGDSQ